MKLNKKIFLAALAIGIVAEASAFNVTTGGKSGTYFKVGHNLAQMIPNIQVQSSKGSVENLDRLMSKEADIAMVQLDAVAWYADKKPESQNAIEVIGGLYEECVYIATRKDGKVKDEDDLQKEGVTIAVGKQGSGSAVTWDYMRKLEPGYKKASVVFKGGSRALAKLALGNDSGIDAVMWVTKPVLTGKAAQTVMNNKNLKFINVNDKDLNDKYKPIGRPIYNFRSIETEKGFFNDSEVKTICMDAALVARADADEDLLDALSDVVLNYKTSLLPKAK